MNHAGTGRARRASPLQEIAPAAGFVGDRDVAAKCIAGRRRPVATGWRFGTFDILIPDVCKIGLEKTDILDYVSGKAHPEPSLSQGEEK